MNRFLFLLAFSLFLFSAQGQMADRVFLNGKIYTANEAQEFVQAVAVLDGLIIYAGDDDGVQQHIDGGTAVHDLEGKLMLPGMHDVHIHLLEASAEGGSACTLDSWAWTVQELGQELSDCNPQPNDNGWIFAWGHSIFTMLEDNANPIEVLDSFFPEIPVAVMEETSHSAWVNSAALAELGIDADSEDPVGGHIVMEDGEPNGLLLDSAGDMAFAAVFAANNALDEDYYNGMVNFGFPSIAEFGITSICEGRTYWKRNYIEVWEQLKEDGEMTARVVLAPWAHPEDDDEDLIPALTGLYNSGDDMLRINQVKVYIDGLAINGTAALDQNYVYNFGWPFTNGMNYFTPERLETYITELELMGYDFHIHAIGNRGVQESLDAIEGARNANGDVGARHRVTHIEIVNEAEYDRFAELNVTADAQVSANWTQPNQWQQNAPYIGSELSENYIPIKSVFDAGGRVTLSSDWDVSTMNPFRSIQNAVTRAPQELPSVEEAVDARTIHSAYVMRQEETTGSIEVGKFADLICVDQDIFSIPQNQIQATNVTMTMLAGDVVYEADGFPQNVDVVQKFGFEMKPNITRDYTTILAPNEHHNWNVAVRDAGGQLIKTEKITGSSHRLNCEDLEEGMYLVTLISEAQTLTRKLVVYR